MKRFWLAIFGLLLTGTVGAQSPQLSKKVELASFKLQTFDEANKLLASGDGFFVSSDGLALSSLDPFIGAYSARVITAAGDTLVVRHVLAQNYEADAAKIQIKLKDGQEVENLPINQAALRRTDKLNVWEARDNQRAYLRQLPVTVTKRERNYYKVIFNTLGIPPGNPVIDNEGHSVAMLTRAGAIVVAEDDFFKPLPNKSKRWQPFVGKRVQLIDRECPADAQLRLEAIEHLPNETKLYFTYTNLQILSETQQKVSGAYPLSLTFTGNEGFFIEETADTADESNPKRNLRNAAEFDGISSTLSANPLQPNTLTFGQSVSFSVSFQKLPELTLSIHIRQGERGLWNFNDVHLLTVDTLRALPPAEYPLETAYFFKQLGLAKIQEGDYASAIEWLEKHLSTAQTDAEAYNLLGVAYFRQRTPAFAIDSLAPAIINIEKAMKLKPLSLHYVYNRSRIYGSLNDQFSVSNEVEDLQTIRRQCPQNLAYRRDYIAALQRANRNREALVLLDSIFVNKQAVWYDYLLRGNANFALDLQSAACKDWQKAFEISTRPELIDIIQEKCAPSLVKPNQPLEYYIDMGNRYFDKRDYLNAVAHYQAAIRKNPIQADLYYLRGRAYYFHMEQTRNKQTTSDKFFYVNCAMRDLTKAVGMYGLSENAFSQAYYLKGQTFKILDNKLDAIADLTKSLTGNQLPQVQTINVWRDLAELYSSMNNRAKACEYWQKAAAKNDKASIHALDKNCEGVRVDPSSPIYNTLTHTVKQGETLDSIARDYRLTPDELKRMNHMESDTLSAGQAIIVHP